MTSTRKKAVQAYGRQVKRVSQQEKEGLIQQRGTLMVLQERFV